MLGCWGWELSNRIANTSTLSNVSDFEQGRLLPGSSEVLGAEDILREVGNKRRLSLSVLDSIAYRQYV